MHQGWWSFEFCGISITQFHVEAQVTSSHTRQPTKSGGEKAEPVEKLTSVVTDKVSLGKLSDRTVTVKLNTPLEIMKIPIPTNSFPRFDNLPAAVHDLSRVTSIEVTDLLRDGDVCEPSALAGNTDRISRTTQITSKCCSPEEFAKGNKRNPVPLERFIKSIIEAKNTPCYYEAQVCDQRLCFEKSVLSASDPTDIPTLLAAELEGQCYQLNTGGWWTYEYCFGSHLRQFHADQTVDSKGKMRIVQTAENTLGEFPKVKSSGPSGSLPPPTAIVPAESWRDLYSLNAVDSMPASSHDPASAYFEHPLPGGSVCEEKEVTETIGYLERSAMVRYYCGKATGLVAVEETSSCKYQVSIAVRSLCGVPGFGESGASDTKQWKCDRIQAAPADKVQPPPAREKNAPRAESRAPRPKEVVEVELELEGDIKNQVFAQQLLMEQRRKAAASRQNQHQIPDKLPSQQGSSGNRNERNKKNSI
jgi:hypothetical protein